MLNVLILAAGLGTRLRPLTTSLPKPLVPIVDDSILAHQIRLAKTLGPISLHVNAFYLAEILKKEANRLGIEQVWVESPEILGTGGPLRRLYQEGVRGDLLVLNGDCYTGVDLSEFLANSKKSRALLSLLGVEEPRINSLQIGSDSILSGISGYFGIETSVKTTFSGISWYKEEALSQILDSERNIVDYWHRLFDSNQKIFVDLSQNKALWVDMGTPLGLIKANFARLAELGVDSWIHPDHPLVNSEEFKARLEHSVIHAEAKIGSGAILDHSLLFDGAVVLENEYVKNQIRGADFVWDW